jgi:hypothetical protein
MVQAAVCGPSAAWLLLGVAVEPLSGGSGNWAHALKRASELARRRAVRTPGVLDRDAGCWVTIFPSHRAVRRPAGRRSDRSMGRGSIAGKYS